MKKRNMLLLKWDTLLFLKNGGGKHFHFVCLVKYYKDKKYSQEKITELIEDADRRHDSHMSKTIKKGTLTKKKFNTRKATKKDRDELFNYFYGYYGLKNATKKLNSMVDSLNAGEDYDDIRNVKIPYYQLKDMLVYYRKELDRSYANKNKKDGFINPLSRIFYDISIVINNLEDYINRREVVYNQINNNKVEGGETLEDYSIYLNFKRSKKDSDDFKKIEELHELSDILGEVK